MNSESARKMLRWGLFLAYMLFLLWITILSRQPRTGTRIFKGELFWSYRAWIAGDSLGKIESIQNVKNILVFIPFGSLFPGKRWRWLFITVFLFSATIEAVQYGFNLGWCEIDDVICNVLGAAIGFILWKMIKVKTNAA